jgi:hypothetical protein
MPWMMPALLKALFVPTFLVPTPLLLLAPVLSLLLQAPLVSTGPPSGDFRLPWLGQYGPG